MAKKKITSVMAVNQYPHNLNKLTIVTDRNSFEKNGERYVLNGDTIINIQTKVSYNAPWSVVEQYMNK